MLGFKYFKEDEFKCKCGCGLNNSSHLMKAMLDSAREEAGVPFKINSGTRCEQHNKNVGGSPTSSHVKGLAVDISVTTSADRDKILRALIKAGFKRIGIYKTFIHADIDTKKPTNVIWLG